MANKPSSLTAIWRNDTYLAINPTRSELSVSGKTVVITGASSGIGRETVKAFAAAGASHIALLARRPALLEKTKSIVESEFVNAEISLHSADISNEEEVTAAAKAIGPWNILVMNAGYLATPDRIESASLPEWWKGFETNVKGIIVTAQAFLPSRKRQAVVISTNTSATALPLMFQATYSSYTNSKLAAMRILEIMAIEYPDAHFVSFNPGVVETDMFEKSGMAGRPGLTLDSVKLPAHFAVWLASSEAAFLRGKMVRSNWDVDELQAKAKAIQETQLLTTGISGW